MTKKKKGVKLCQKCQFHNKDTDDCQVKDVKECSKQSITECNEFLIHKKFVMF